MTSKDKKSEDYYGDLLKEKILQFGKENKDAEGNLDAAKTVKYVRLLNGAIIHFRSNKDIVTFENYCLEITNVLGGSKCMEDMSGDDLHFLFLVYMRMASLVFNPEIGEYDDIDVNEFDTENDKFEFTKGVIPRGREIIDLIPFLYHEFRYPGQVEIIRKMSSMQVKEILGITHMYMGRCFSCFGEYHLLQRALPFFQNGILYLSTPSFVSHDKNNNNDNNQEKGKTIVKKNAKLIDKIHECLFHYADALNQLCEILYVSMKDKMVNKIRTLSQEEIKERMDKINKINENNKDGDEVKGIKIAELLSQEQHIQEIGTHSKLIISILHPVYKKFRTEQKQEKTKKKKAASNSFFTKDETLRFLYFLSRGYFYQDELNLSLRIINEAVDLLPKSYAKLTEQNVRNEKENERMLIYNMIHTSKGVLLQMMSDPEILGLRKEIQDVTSDILKEEKMADQIQKKIKMLTVTCANCGKGEQQQQQQQEKIKFQRCARCKNVLYCSRKCQIEHWKGGHRQECNTNKFHTVKV